MQLAAANPVRPVALVGVLAVLGGGMFVLKSTQGGGGSATADTPTLLHTTAKHRQPVTKPKPVATKPGGHKPVVRPKHHPAVAANGFPWAVAHALVKNPVGFNEVLSTLLHEPGPKPLMIVINDKFADGTDVSWLWDVDFELLAGRVSFAVVSGIRAEDMGVRLKYAGVNQESIIVEPDLSRALDRALQATPEGETLYLLPTYTAMLEVRGKLSDAGYLSPFWED
jgi:hypothetical protein